MQLFYLRKTFEVLFLLLPIPEFSYREAENKTRQSLPAPGLQTTNSTPVRVYECVHLVNVFHNTVSVVCACACYRCVILGEV